jgi:hypothetical protein
VDGPPMPTPQICSMKQKLPSVRKLPAYGIHRLSISQNAGLFLFVSTYREIGSGYVVGQELEGTNRPSFKSSAL